MMEVSSSLLVAMMFVMVLSIGIANILMTLAGMFHRRSQLKFYWVHLSWMVLLLLLYFNLFWHTMDILSSEDWTFDGFLYIVAGPIILLFATQILSPDPTGAESNDLRVHYFGISREFFYFLAMLQLWIIGSDFVLGAGFQTASAYNGVLAVLALFLATSQRSKTHTVGAVVAWVLLLLAPVLRIQGIMS